MNPSGGGNPAASSRAVVTARSNSTRC